MPSLTQSRLSSIQTKAIAILDEIYGWTDIRRATESDFDVVREAAAKLGVTSD